MRPKLCVVFICQAGELEIKASLLAASLYWQHKALTGIDWVVAVADENLFGELSSSVKAFLKRLGFRLAAIEAPFGNAYPIGNKIAAIGVETDAPNTLFLDSDIICLGNLTNMMSQRVGLKAKPADFNTFSATVDQWAYIYSLFEQVSPPSQVRSTVSNELMPLYFNAGVVSVENGARFSQVWLETAKMIDSDDAVTNKRPWLDQIALPIAARRLGLSCGALTERFNYPAHVRPLQESGLPVLCHYHSPDIIAQEPALRAYLKQLLLYYPELSQIVTVAEAWRDLCSNISVKTRRKTENSWLGSRFWRRSITQHSVTKNDFLITGIPRSGTSLLCNLLHRHKDIVVINEPQEVFSLLQPRKNANEFASYYRRLRAEIVSGIPVENKLDGAGNVIEDTRLCDERVKQVIPISSASFTLGTKNPLAYLARLRWICDNYPEIRIVAMVRHPYDAIASWNKSFDHLKLVDCSKIPFSSVEDAGLDAFQKQQLQAIQRTQSLSMRRALLWSYLADLILRDQDRLHLLRYEDLVANGRNQMHKVLTWLQVSGEFSMRGVSLKSDRQSGAALAAEDREAIGLLCAAQAEKLGYEL